MASYVPYKTKDYAPFTALFPYEELVREEEEKKKRLIEGQQKIQRTNALGNALTLIADTIGATAGGTVAPRQPGTGISRASERIAQVQDRGDDAIMRLRLIDLANRQRDLAYQQGIEAEERAALRRAQELQEQWARQKEQQEAEQLFRSTEAEKAGKRAIDLETEKSRNTLKEIWAREQAKRKDEALQENPFLARYKSIHGNKAPFMTLPDLEMGVDIPLSDSDAMQLLKWMRNDPAVSTIDKKNITPQNLTNNLAFKNIVIDNWDRYKPLVRKMAGGEKITAEDEKALYDAGNRAKRIAEYETRRQVIDPTKRKGAKQLEALNKEYADLFEMPGTQQTAGSIELKPEELTKIDGMLNARGFSPEQKRSTAYSYLIKQGYDEASAREFAEYLYQNIK